MLERFKQFNVSISKFPSILLFSSNDNAYKLFKLFNCSIFVILFAAITMSMCEDLVDVIQTDKTEISRLKNLNDYYSGEAAKYKVMYEDLYDIYVFPQEQKKAGVYND